MSARIRVQRLLLCTSLVLLTALAGATLWAAPTKPEPAPTATTQWQFALLKVPVDTPNTKLGSQILKMGREGWDLVSVENFAKDGTTTETAYYFKRPL